MGRVGRVGGERKVAGEVRGGERKRGERVEGSGGLVERIVTHNVIIYYHNILITRTIVYSR